MERINNAIENHPVKDKSSDNWQCNVLSALGMSDEDIDKRPMRGFVSEHEYMGEIGDGDAKLKMCCEEAWSRTGFAEVLHEIFPDISIYWIAEESGCGIYETNDSEGGFYPERYYVDTCIGGEYDSEYFTNEADAYEWLSQRSDCKCAADVEAFNENRRKADSDDFIYVHEFEVV